MKLTKWQFVKALWAAWRGPKRKDYQMIWNKDKSVAKANQTVKDAVVGVGGAGTALASVMAFARSAAPDSIPWDASMDGYAVAIAGGIIGSAVAWFKSYFRDKAKHGGQPITATPTK